MVIVTGILGPGHNAHGPNEMLNIEYVKKFLCCVCQIMADTYDVFRADKEES